MITTLYLVRHGESEANLGGDIIGLDTPLTPTGEEQAAALAARLQNVPIDVFFASTLKRAAKTANIIAQTRNLPVTLTPHLRERYWGMLEGKRGSEINEKYRDQFETFKKQTRAEQLLWKVTDEMENAQQVIDRSLMFLDEITTKHQQKTLLAVSHGNVMRILLVHFGFADFSELPYGSIKNTGYAKIEKSNGVYKVVETHQITKAAGLTWGA